MSSLATILKGHEGEIFYCTFLGRYVELYKIDNLDQIVIKNTSTQVLESLGKNGEIREDGECMLFPGRNQRSWCLWGLRKKKNNLPNDLLGASSFQAYYQEWLRDVDIDVGAFRDDNGFWVGYYSFPGQEMRVTGLQDTYDEAFRGALEEVFENIIFEDP